jgi:hypothetical protein
MTQRKGEITLPEIKRKWPHHVALSADKVHGLANSELVWSFAATLSAAPRPYTVRNDGDDDLVVFCFAKPEDAQAFTERFGGERLPVTRPAMSLTAEQRRALELIAGSPRGCTKGRLLTDGFDADMLADLVREGLATAQRGTMRVGGREIRVERYRITDAGRRAIES